MLADHSFRYKLASSFSPKPKMLKSYQQLNHHENASLTSHEELHPASASSGKSTAYYLVICIFIFSFIITLLYLNGGDTNQLDKTQEATLRPVVKPSGEQQDISPSSSETECNWFEGQWVFDNESVPLYDGKGCEYITEQLSCEKYGRKDLSYQKWRWQPHHCTLPRFNATSVLEKLRNKRLVYVGDSLNRGQWFSMVCMVEHVIRPNLKSLTVNGSLSSFKAIEYNATIEYYWAPLLVESNSDDPNYHRNPDKIVRVQAIEKHARHWTNADVLVFDSYLWWLGDKMKVLWGSFGSPDAVYKDVDMPMPFEMALRTWAEWLEVNIDGAKTQMFFVSMSPIHYSAEDWGGATGQTCYNETEPIRNASYWGRNSVVSLMKIAERAVSDLQTRGLNIKLLNITQMSEYRKDGHLTIYRKQYEPLTKEQLANPTSYADCAHWCLPGVPDTWNEILHTYTVGL